MALVDYIGIFYISEYFWQMTVSLGNVISSRNRSPSPTVFSGGRVAWSLVFCVVFCRSLFGILTFFVCLCFDFHIQMARMPLLCGGWGVLKLWCLICSRLITLCSLNIYFSWQLNFLMRKDETVPPTTTQQGHSCICICCYFQKIHLNFHTSKLGWTTIFFIHIEHIC
jgi:hypothetical protein